MEEGLIYTKGNSFRAKAEKEARLYRSNILKIKNYDKWGHILSDDDAAQGLNFIDSDRKQIFDAVKERARIGKGVDVKRTTKNLLSSQAMCFNFFHPLSCNKENQNKLMPKLVGNEFKEICGQINIEYTPDNNIFNDQSSKGGVDADVYMMIRTKNESLTSVIIETKYVEKEFSQCGFTKSTQKDKCPQSLILDNSEFEKLCKYEYKKNYKYWTIAQKNNVFNLNKITHCPFRQGLWQLFTNITLASELAQRNNCSQYKYIVLCRKDNIDLAKEKYDLFKQILTDENVFKVIYLEDLKQTISECGQWGKDFIEKYIW